MVASSPAPAIRRASRHDRLNAGEGPLSATPTARSPAAPLMWRGLRPGCRPAKVEVVNRAVQVGPPRVRPNTWAADGMLAVRRSLRPGIAPGPGAGYPHGRQPSRTPHPWAMSPRQAAGSRLLTDLARRANFGHCRAPYHPGVTSHSRFTLDEARVVRERIGVDLGSAPLISSSSVRAGWPLGL